MERKDDSTKIKVMRQKLGLSQVEFAEKYSIPRRTIENWESGSRKPPKYVVILLESVIKHQLEKEGKSFKEN